MKLGAHDVAYTAAFAACAVLLTSLWSRFVGRFTLALGIWALCETVFFLRRRSTYHRLNALNPSRPDESGIRSRVTQFKTLVGVVSLEEFLSGWFMNTPYEELSRDNILEFVAYGFWYKRFADMTPDEKQQVSEVFDELAATFSCATPPPGYNPSLRFMAHMWEPMRVVHKPLFVHVFSEVSLGLSHACLLALGFSRHHIGGHNYWARGLGAPVDTSDADAFGDDTDSGTRWGGSDATPYAPADPFTEAVRAAGKARTPAAAEHRRRLSGAIRTAAAAAASGIHALADAASGHGLLELLEDPPVATDAAALLGVRVPSAHELADLVGTGASPVTTPRGAVPPPPPAPALSPPPAAAAATPTPVVFLHGVGLGMLPYLAFIWGLVRGFSGRPVLVLEVRHVSLRLCGQARTVDDVAQAVMGMLRRHGVRRAHFAAHSFGTFVVAHLRHLYPHAIASMLLCDPVCMLTCCPQLIRNFIYNGVSVTDVLRRPAALLKAMVARDLIIAETFCRHFWWHTLTLWPDELTAPTVLLLSNNDDLVPCELVQRQVHASLTEPGAAPAAPGPPPRDAVRVFVTGGTHGAFLVKNALQRELIVEWRHLIARFAAD